MAYETPAQAVQWIMMIACVLMGLSHIIRQDLWAAYFTKLRDMGTAGAVLNAQLTLIPALFIVVLHQVWTWPGVVLTIYGWLLLIKAAAALLIPGAGEASLKMAEGGKAKFAVAGIGLLGIAAASGAALFGG